MSDEGERQANASQVAGLNRAEAAFVSAVARRQDDGDDGESLLDGTVRASRERLSELLPGDGEVQSGDCASLSSAETEIQQIELRYDARQPSLDDLRDAGFIDPDVQPFDQFLDWIRSGDGEWIISLGVFQLGRLVSELDSGRRDAVRERLNAETRAAFDAAVSASSLDKAERARLAEMYVSDSEDLSLSAVCNPDSEHGDIRRRASMLGLCTLAGAAVGIFAERLDALESELSGTLGKPLRRHRRVASVSSRRDLSRHFVASVAEFVDAHRTGILQVDHQTAARGESNE